MGCNNLRKTLIITLAILCSIILVLPVLAGQGDGSGGGKNQPLAMLSSSPADGQKDVALPVEIKMTFSKNVVYMTVRDNNSKCFTMYSQDGKQVPIEVIMADDQIEFDKRRDIVVKPLQELQGPSASPLQRCSKGGEMSSFLLHRYLAANPPGGGIQNPVTATTSRSE